MSLQYTGGYSVHWGYHEYTGGVQYTGDIMSTPGVFKTLRGHLSTPGVVSSLDPENYKLECQN